MKSKVKMIIRKAVGTRLFFLITKPFEYPAIYSKNIAARYILFFFYAPILLLRYRKKRIIPWMEMCITTRCSLTCKECSHLMPSYMQEGKARDFEIGQLIKNIDLFLPLIDNCLVFSILGGEPFLHKEMYKVLDRLTADGKVKRVFVTTNGTITPTEENLRALCHKKVYVRISNYGALSRNIPQLQEIFAKSGISYILSPQEKQWEEIGGLYHRGYSQKEMEYNYCHCPAIPCKHLFNGRLWLCPLALHGVDLGLVPESKREYIDLSACNREEFWGQLNRLYDEPHGFSSCYYCQQGYAFVARKVPAAEQIRQSIT